MGRRPSARDLSSGKWKMRNLQMDLEEIKENLKRLAHEFGLEYRPESYSFFFLSKREILLRNYLAAPTDHPMYEEFGATPEERIQNLEKFLCSFLYTKMTGSGSTEGCVMTREELDQERSLLFRIQNPELRAEYQALYAKIAQHMKGKWLVLLSMPETERERQSGLEYLVLHEWIHVLLMDNGIFFQAQGKDWRLDEGLVTYMMAFLEKEELDPKSTKGLQDKLTKYHKALLEAAHRWWELLHSKGTPKERKETILALLQE